MKTVILIFVLCFLSFAQYSRNPRGRVEYPEYRYQSHQSLSSHCRAYDLNFDGRVNVTDMQIAYSVRHNHDLFDRIASVILSGSCPA
jgi:hypothetical protein